MRFALAVLLILLAPSVSAIAETPPADTPRFAHDRMVQMLRNGDFEAWRAAFDPKRLERESVEFAQEMASPRDSALKRAWAVEAEVSLDRLKSLTSEELARKRFFAGLEGLLLFEELSVYLATPIESEDVARIEFLHPDGTLSQKRFRKVDGSWKFVETERQSPGQERSANEVFSVWVDAIRMARGKELLEVYSSEILWTYLRTWGPELGTIQVAGSEERKTLAYELNVDPVEFIGMSATRFVELRLHQHLNAWLSQDDNQWEMNHLCLISYFPRADKVTYKFAIPDILPTVLTHADGWRITADFLDEHRMQLIPTTKSARDPDDFPGFTFEDETLKKCERK